MLETTWFVLWGLLWAVYFVLDGFDFGMGTLLPFLAKNDEEKRIMEGHVEHSRRVLQNIEFDLPIVAAIYEMNERMDGTGYPRHIKGDEISIFGRLLAVTNAFTAMIRPRSYRSAMDVKTIMQILKEQSFHYDPEIVAALDNFLETPAGERLLRSLQSN